MFTRFIKYNSHTKAVIRRHYRQWDRWSNNQEENNYYNRSSKDRQRDSERFKFSAFFFLLAGYLGSTAISNNLLSNAEPGGSDNNDSHNDTNGILNSYTGNIDTTNPSYPPIYRIVITGGPCAGKTTAINAVAHDLTERGYVVYRVPEAATFIIGGTRIFPPALQGDQRMEFEASLVQAKIDIESAFIRIAKAGDKPCVILCDRGTMDTAAYIERDVWKVILKKNGWNEKAICDNRYDGVIHMVSAAIGAETYYTLENNEARSESIEEAMKIDDKLKNVWERHPKRFVIDNSTDFIGKIRRVENAIRDFLGIEEGGSTVNK